MEANEPSVELLGTLISRRGFESALKACAGRDRALGGYVCFVNVHTLTESTSDQRLRRAFADAFLATADGVPLLWAARLAGHPVESRVCGPDFMNEFLKTHAADSHGFIGGAPGRAQELAARFGIQAICHSPPMRPFSEENAKEDWQRFLDLCPGRRPPRWIWVGLGAPKQELWMRAVSPSVNESLFFGVGAAFDFLSGTKARAPKWLQRSGLEWAYRLAQEPRRLGGRYLTANSKFIALIALQLGRGKSSQSNQP